MLLHCFVLESLVIERSSEAILGKADALQYLGSEPRRTLRSRSLFIEMSRSSFRRVVSVIESLPRDWGRRGLAMRTRCRPWKSIALSYLRRWERSSPWRFVRSKVGGLRQLPAFISVPFPRWIMHRVYFMRKHCAVWKPTLVMTAANS